MTTPPELSFQEREMISIALACAAASSPRDINPEPHGYLNTSVSADRDRFVALKVFADEEFFQRYYEAWCNWHKTPMVQFRDLESLE